jgi:hypothetical protein
MGGFYMVDVGRCVQHEYDTHFSFSKPNRHAIDDGDDRTDFCVILVYVDRPYHDKLMALESLAFKATMASDGVLRCQCGCGHTGRGKVPSAAARHFDQFFPAK